MSEYLIGSGAIISTGPSAAIAGAALHAQTDPGIAGSVQAALVDFEALENGDLSQIVIIAAGWNTWRFDRNVVSPLLAHQSCSLSDVLRTLASAVGTRQIHLFARWMPKDGLISDLRGSQIELIAHPLEAIAQAALVSGRNYARWQTPLQAA